MSRKTDTKKSAKKPAEGFTAEEKAAMRERAKELKAEARGARTGQKVKKPCLPLLRK